MGELLDNIEVLTKNFANATELYRFYQQSELVKLSIILSDLFHRYSQTSDEYVKKHLKVDIDDIITKYKNALQKIGIDLNSFSW